VTASRLRASQLQRRAGACGVATSYRDWQGRLVEVSDDTLVAILEALGPPPVPGQAPGLSGVTGRDHPVAPAPSHRGWGFTVQLYSLRSHGSWGHGDFADLAALARWSGGLGAGFVLINPLHAAEPTCPVSPSPYLPMSRRFVSPLYLRVEDIPEYSALPEAGRRRIEVLAAPLRAASATPDLIDRDRVWSAKREALEIIHATPLGAPRRERFERFLMAQGQPLTDWATWCALAEVHGGDQRAWPAALRDPHGAPVAQERRRLAGAVRFHAWLQWLADEQRAAAQAAARSAGMSIGVIGDLAVGAHPGGADAWALSDVLVPGMSVGAPPDEFNQRGQDWSQPPWHPGRLAAAGYAPLAGLIRAGFSRGGGLRADHVMGLFRLWWVPAGKPPDQGTYVRYRHEAMTGALTGEAAKAGALAIGEDLGTVEPWISDYLAARGVLGTSMLWFERDASGAPRPPAGWRAACLATVGTHDVPPAAAFFTGEQVTLRSRLGLLTRDLAAEQRAAQGSLARWRGALVAQGLLAPGGARGAGEFTAGEFTAGEFTAGEFTAGEFTVALYAYLARTPAALIGVSLADAVGDRRPQNMPGTTTEYPNWQVPLCDGDGRAVLLEQLPRHPGVAAVVGAVCGVSPAAPGATPAPRPGTHL
jgi:4-alpha-glucanotransferase